MSDIDEILRKRLENLRADRIPPSQASTSQSLPKTVRKTAAEQVEDLLRQLSDVATLEGKEKGRIEDEDSQLRKRLERLKSREDCDFAPSGPITKVEKSPEELADAEYFNKSSCSDLLAVLEKGSSDNESGLSSSDSRGSSDSEILCHVCDEKPTLICVDCQNDYFCDKCFKEYHSDEEEHKTAPFVKRK